MELLLAWPGAGAQTEAFRSLLARIGSGDPLGAAMSYLADRYAEVATELALAIEQVRRGRRPNDEQFAGLWTAYADARDFVVLGDPAVSLGRVAHEPADGSHVHVIASRTYLFATRCCLATLRRRSHLRRRRAARTWSP